MKISRISFAAVLVLAAAACSADVTAPGPEQLAPAASSQSAGVTVPIVAPEDAPEGSGLLGSTGG